MDEARVSVVAEVQRREVEEVNDQDELGPVEVRANEEHDECEVEEVVGDEMASNTGGGMNMARIGREEVGNVATLKNEEDDPAIMSVHCIRENPDSSQTYQ